MFENHFLQHPDEFVVTSRLGWDFHTASRYLHLAATPIFGIMATLTGLHGAGVAGSLCSASPKSSPLTGMAVVYLLMSLFHSPPWLKLISAWRAGRMRK